MIVTKMENKKENKDGKMTLEKLGQMVANGFGEVNEKMATKEEMKAGFQEVKVKLAEHDVRFSKLEYRMDEIYDIVIDREKDVLDLQVRVNKLEDNVKILNKQI